MNDADAALDEVMRRARDYWGDDASEGPYCKQEIIEGLGEILAAVAGAPLLSDAIDGVSLCSPCPLHQDTSGAILADHIPDGDDERAVAALARAARGTYRTPGPVTVHKGRWTVPGGRTWVVTRGLGAAPAGLEPAISVTGAIADYGGVRDRPPAGDSIPTAHGVLGR